MATCAEAQTLRADLRKNCWALIRTVPLVVEGIEDDDIAFALIELGHLQSQVRGTLQLLEQAHAKGIRLVGADVDSPSASTPGALESLGNAIKATLSRAPAADVLSVLIGSTVGLVVELMRREGHDASKAITIDGGENRDLTIHAEKRGPLQ